MHPHFQHVGERSLNWNENQEFSVFVLQIPSYFCIYHESGSPNVNVLFLSAVESTRLSVLGLVFEDLFIAHVFEVYMHIYSSKSRCTFIDET